MDRLIDSIRNDLNSVEGPKNTRKTTTTALLESVGENSHINYFMTSLHERILPDVRIKPAIVYIQGGRASDH